MPGSPKGIRDGYEPATHGPGFTGTSRSPPARPGRRPSVDRPESGGDQLGEVAIRVTEVDALRPAGPGHEALDGHALGFEAALPRLHVLGGDREGEVVSPAR